MNAPERGDIVVLDFDPQAGHEQMKRRPALVLSPTSFNRVFGLAFVAPITGKPKGHGFEVVLPAGCGATGSVMAHQTKSLDWRARKARKSGSVDTAILDEVSEIVRDILA